MKKFKKILRSLKRSFVTVSRFLRFGDSHKVVFFETLSSENKTLPSRRDVLRWISPILKEMGRTFVRAYRVGLGEAHTLHPDPLSTAGGESYGKCRIGFTYKNAFSLSHAPQGSVSLNLSDEAAEGIYFWVGKKFIETGDGLLDLFLEGKDSTKIFSKKLNALHHAWDLFYFPLAQKSGEYKFTWSTQGEKKDLLLTPPLIKRKQERTVLLLIADAVRPQDIGLYSGAVHTPMLDAYFSSGVLFQNSFAQSNWTLPAFASIATSHYASEHGVVDPDRYSRPMDRHVPTLGEVMRAHGFYTYGSVSHFRSNQAYGHHRGFEHFDYASTMQEKPGTTGVAGQNNMHRQLRELCAYVDNLRGVNFFGMIHFFDTHFPYFYNPYQLNQHDLLFQNSLEYSVRKPFTQQFTEEEYRYMLHQYYTRLAELDAALAQLFYVLRNRENVTVLFMSDHGYCFEKSLGHDLSSDEIATPLFISSTEFKLEGGKHQRVTQSSVDILPTLTTLFGIHDVTARAGTSLFDRSGKVLQKEVAVSELIYHELYQVRLIGKKGATLLFETKRSRKSGTIEVDQLFIKDNRFDSPSETSLEMFLASVESSKLFPSLKKKMCELIRSGENLQ